MKLFFIILMSGLTLVSGSMLILTHENYPNPSQSDGKAVLEQFKAEYAKLNGKKDFFEFPSESIKQSCEVDQEELNKAFGLSNRMTNIKIYPFSLSCKNNKPDGQSEFLISYDIKNVMNIGNQSTATTLNQFVIRTNVVFVDGKIEKSYAPVFLRSVVKTTWDNPQMQEMMDKAKDPNAVPNITIAFNNFKNAKSLKSAAFTVLSMPKVGGFFGTSIDHVSSLLSAFVFTISPDHTVNEAYTDQKRTGIMPMKNMKLHGEAVVYSKNFAKLTEEQLRQTPGLENAKLVLVDGEDMIETRLCYVNGILTKTTECPKD